MEPARATWTDERLDDLAGRIDRGFADLRSDMDKGFERVDKGFERVDKCFERVDKGFERVDGDIRDFRRTIHRFGSGIIVALLVVLVGGLLG